MSKTIINDTNLEITDFKVNKQNELEELQINGNEVSLGEESKPNKIYCYKLVTSGLTNYYFLAEEKSVDELEIGDLFYTTAGAASLIQHEYEIIYKEDDVVRISNNGGSHYAEGAISRYENGDVIFE